MNPKSEVAVQRRRPIWPVSPVWPAWCLAAMLAGCSSLQQPAPPGALPAWPAAWSAAAPTAAAGALPSPAAWWAQFNDPALPALVAQALGQGTSIASAQARLRQARAARDAAAAALQPGLQGGASAQASRRAATTTTSQTWAATLDASWEADLWGAGAAGLRAADADAAASGLSLAATQLQVAAETAAALLELRGTQARLALAERSLASQRQTLQLVAWRQEAGLVSALDVEQARTAEALAAATLPGLRSAVQQGRHALALLTGQPPAALDALLATPADPAPPAAPAQALALAIPAEVLRQRPDVLAAERSLAAAAARVDAADAQRLPSLQLGGSLGLQALRLGALGSGAGVASLLASVSVPVFDAGRLQAQVQQQEAARDLAAQAWRATVLAALREVEDTLVQLQAAQDQAALQQQAVDSARRAAQLAEHRYRSGLIDIQTVLQSQRTQFSAEDSLAATRTSLATAHVRLYKALGGGWTPPTPTVSGGWTPPTPTVSGGWTPPTPPVSGGWTPPTPPVSGGWTPNP